MRIFHNGFATNFGLVGTNLRRYMATTALTATGLMAIATPAMAENWTDHVATEGSISIDTSVANTTNITQHTHFTKVQGNGDINAGWTVNLAQPSTSSKYVLYDVKDDPTRILGTLNANGQVFIFDKNGVIFGEGSQVNVGAITASTGFISDANIQADKFVFETVGGADAGAVINEGTITVADAGLAAFVAPTVKNSGRITANAGKVVLASGETVTLDLYGDKLVEIAADGALADALIDNSGNIEAAGGTVVLSAQAARDAVDNVINMNGVVDVSSVSVKGGKIILGGGNKGVVKVAGALKADGQTGGGEVKVTGQNIHLTESSTVSASALTTGDGGEVHVVAQNGLVYGGSIAAKGGVFGGNGGFVDTSGLDWVDIYGTVDASASNGANGTWLIDPTNLTISGLPSFDLGGNGSAANPFRPTGSVSNLRNTVLNAALTGGTNVIVTTVGSSDSFGQDGTITVAADITSAGSGTLTLDAAGNIFVLGRTIAASVGNTLNVVMKAAKDILLYGANINTRSGDLNIDAGGFVSIFDLSQLNTSGGDASITSGTLGHGGFLIGNGSAINTSGGDITVQVNGPVLDAGGPPISGTIAIRGVLDAGGGHIDMKQSGVLYADANSLRTSDEGTISIMQNSFVDSLGNQHGKIQTAIDAIQNTGTDSANTVTVGAGTFKESLVANVANLVLKGAKAGISGADDARDGTGETIVDPHSPGIRITANNVTVDGLTFTDATGADGYGVWVDGAENANIKNNIIYGTDQDGIYANGATGLKVTRNKIHDGKKNGVLLISSDGAKIIGNTIYNLRAHADNNTTGIHVHTSDDVVIFKNDISKTNWDGIRVLGGENVRIVKNEISETVRTAIFSDQSTNLLVFANELSDIGRFGINIDRSNGLNIWKNNISGAGQNGINVTSARGSVSILRNEVQDIDGHGIYVRNSGAANILKNTISETGGDGVHVLGSDGVKIWKNTIHDGKRNGILLTDSDGAKIIDNTIYNLRAHADNNTTGIHVHTSDGVVIFKNTISKTNWDGIRLLGSDNARIVKNNISEVIRTGIFSDESENLFVGYNKVSNVGRFGINIDRSNGLTIHKNKVSDVGQNGINVTSARGDVTISENRVKDATFDGIFVRSGNLAYILDNKVFGSDDDGIETVGTREVYVIGNKVFGSGDDGITLLGYAEYTGELPAPEEEYEEGGEGEYAPKVYAAVAEGPAPWKAVVQGNKVVRSETDGIQIEGFETIIVTDKNHVKDSGVNGLFVSGPNNGNVIVSGNIFKNNDIGAQFESGLIDLTGEGNTFEGGRIGLRFAPYAFYGEGEGEGEGNYDKRLPAFAALEMPYIVGYAPLQLVDDGVTYPAAPGPFFGTIGSQIFTGYTGGGEGGSKYYVQLANGAFYQPGEPTLLNGADSSYDNDIKPFLTGGVLTPEELAFLEERFHHYPDGLETGEDLGLFWFGYVPAVAAGLDIDQKDLFNTFNTFNGGSTGLNVRIVGLPRLPGQGGGGAPTPQDLNQIQTFGGTPEELNQIETAAGGQSNDPQELSEIETEAGGEANDTNCWSEAMNIAGNGQAVNVVYQGTLDDSLEQAAACGTAF